MTKNKTLWHLDTSRPPSDPWWAKISAPDFQRDDLPCQILYKQLGPFDHDPFFTSNDIYDKTSPSTRAAKNACAACPVQVECLEYALVAQVPQGIWGGTTPEERRQIRRKRRI